jgi:hypothetical protein
MAVPVEGRAAKSGWVSYSLANHNEPPRFFLMKAVSAKMGHLQR